MAKVTYSTSALAQILGPRPGSQGISSSQGYYKPLGRLPVHLGRCRALGIWPYPTVDLRDWALAFQGKEDEDTVGYMLW